MPVSSQERCSNSFPVVMKLSTFFAQFRTLSHVMLHNNYDEYHSCKTRSRAKRNDVITANQPILVSNSRDGHPLTRILSTNVLLHEKQRTYNKARFLLLLIFHILDAHECARRRILCPVLFCTA